MQENVLYTIMLCMILLTIFGKEKSTNSLLKRMKKRSLQE